MLINNFLSFLKGDDELLVSEFKEGRIENFLWTPNFNFTSDAFVSPGIRRNAKELAAQGKRGGKGDVVYARGLWLDFDFKSCEVELEELKSRWLEPSLVVMSGGGYHLWWLAEDKIYNVEKYLQMLLGIFPEADPAPSTAASMMRIPGTENFKYDPSRTADVVFYSESRISEAKILNEERATIIKNLEELGGSLVSNLEHGGALFRRPGETTAASSARLYPPDADHENFILQVFSSNWPGLPEGTYTLKDFLKKEEGLKVSLPDPLEGKIEKLVEAKRINYEAELRLMKTLASDLGFSSEEDLPKGSLENLIRAVSKEKSLDLLAGSGELGEEYNFVSATEVLQNAKDAPHWLIENLMGVGDLTKLAAEAKSGKTSLVMTLVSAMASSEPLWGNQVLQSPLNVAILDFEMKGHELKNRYLKSVGPAITDNIHLMLVRETDGGSLDIFSKKVQDQFKEKLEHLGIDFLVIDPIADCVYASPASRLSEFDPMNDNSLMTRFLKSVDNIKPWGGALVVHHTNQSGSSRGAKVLDDLPSANWTLTASAFDAPKKLSIKGRSAGNVEMSLLYNETTGFLDADVKTVLDDDDNSLKVKVNLEGGNNENFNI